MIIFSLNNYHFIIIKPFLIEKSSFFYFFYNKH
jgi:hypothetical protein